MTVTLAPPQLWKHAVASLLVAAALSGAPPAGAEAAEPSKDLEARWVPSIVVGVDIHVQSGELEGLSSKTIVSPVIPLEVEVLAPRLGDLAGSPRPFVHVGGQFPVEQDHLLARRDDPDSEFELELQGQVGAGAGLAFALPLGDYRLRIGPSAEYLRGWLRLNATGVSEGRSSDTYDAVGGRLAIEVEAGRRGPVAIGLYVRSQVYGIVGNRDIGPYRMDPMIVQGGAGIRLSWVGFPH